MEIYQTKKGVTEYIKMCDGYDNSQFQSLILKHLPKKKKILEIGMGPGNDFIWLSQYYTVIGSDYSDEFLKRAKVRFPNDSFLLLDAVSINTEQEFDAIYSCKVYQYLDLDEIKKALLRQHEILTPEGLIIHSFWIGDKVFDEGDVQSIYHNKQKILAIISKKFDILEQCIYDEFEKNDSLFVIAQKKV